MVAIQIRNVPENLRDDLANQARAQGKSLQRYLLGLLTREADAGHQQQLLADWARTPLTAGSKGLDAAAYIARQREQQEQDMAHSLLVPPD